MQLKDTIRDFKGIIDLVSMKAIYFDGENGENVREEAVHVFPLEEVQYERRWRGRRRRGVGPSVVMRPVVGAVEHERVVGDAELVELVEELPDVSVVLDHAVGVLVLPGNPPVFGLHVGSEVHPRAIPPNEELLACLVLAGAALVVGRSQFRFAMLSGLLSAPFAFAWQPIALPSTATVTNGRPSMK